jgi:hypothetical protein
MAVIYVLNRYRRASYVLLFTTINCLPKSAKYIITTDKGCLHEWGMLKEAANNPLSNLSPLLI